MVISSTWQCHNAIFFAQNAINFFIWKIGQFETTVLKHYSPDKQFQLALAFTTIRSFCYIKTILFWLFKFEHFSRNSVKSYNNGHAGKKNKHGVPILLLQFFNLLCVAVSSAYSTSFSVGCFDKLFVTWPLFSICVFGPVLKENFSQYTMYPLSYNHPREFGNFPRR